MTGLDILPNLPGQTKVIKSLCQSLTGVLRPPDLALLEAIRKESLSESIARAVSEMIDRKGYRPGDRLPPINEMAHQFRVGAPTLREALRQLQAVGIVEMRHGSGVYVAENYDAMFVVNPIRSNVPSRTTMMDLIDTRLALESYTTALAAESVTDTELEEMGELLSEATEALEDGDLEALSTINMGFHSCVAKASGNGVAHQLLDLLAGLYRMEQYTILQIYGSPGEDLTEHLGILDALKARNPELATERMRRHLAGVREVLANYEDEIPDAPQTT